MLTQNRILGAGIAALMAVGLLALPGQASAQYYRHRARTTREDTTRTNAWILGAAGIALLNNHENTLGTIALGAAVGQVGKLQNEIDDRHRREGRYGRNDRYDNDRYRRGDGDYDRDDRNYRRGDYKNGGYYGNGNYNNNGGYYGGGNYNNNGGYYDRLGGWHRNGDNYDEGYYDQLGGWHKSNRNDHDHDRDDNWLKRDRDHGVRDDGNGLRPKANPNDRGRDWAATRGNKNGWDKNGKRGNRDHDNDGD
jgi:hypothetical protein